jgi:hypothetical protein
MTKMSTIGKSRRELSVWTEEDFLLPRVEVFLGVSCSLTIRGHFWPKIPWRIRMQASSSGNRAYLTMAGNFYLKIYHRVRVRRWTIDTGGVPGDSSTS